MAESPRISVELGAICRALRQRYLELSNEILLRSAEVEQQFLSDRLRAVSLADLDPKPPTRGVNALRQAGVITAADAQQRTVTQLDGIAGVGRKTIEKVTAGVSKLQAQVAPLAAEAAQRAVAGLVSEQRALAPVCDDPAKIARLVRRARRAEKVFLARQSKGLAPVGNRNRDDEQWLVQQVQPRVARIRDLPPTAHAERAGLLGELIDSANGGIALSAGDVRDFTRRRKAPLVAASVVAAMLLGGVVAASNGGDRSTVEVVAGEVVADSGRDSYATASSLIESTETTTEPTTTTAPTTTAPTTTAPTTTVPTTTVPTTTAPTTTTPPTTAPVITAPPTTTAPVITAPAPELVAPESPPTTEYELSEALAEVDDSACDPNYTGCVPIASDVDCSGGSGNGPKYTAGPVEVIGSDIYDLDRDNDGFGCES